MGMNYLMQMLLACFASLLAFPLATSSTLVKTTSKEETICYSCTPIPTLPPPVINCPPPPSPPSPPPPSPPPPTPSPPPPACPSCPPCNACQVPDTPVPGPPSVPVDQQPGVVGGAVYPPPNETVPYFPYSFQHPPPSESHASSTHLELKLVVSIIILLLSATFSFF